MCIQGFARYNHSQSFLFLSVPPTTCSDLELKPVGVLEAKLVQAKDLTNKDVIGKSDPFAVLYIRPLPDRMKKSKIIVLHSTNCPLFLHYTLAYS